MTRAIRLTHGVLRLPEQLPDDVARVAAVLSACAAGSVVAGLTAARLHGLWLPPQAEPPVDVLLRGGAEVPRSLSACRRSEVRGRRRRVHPSDVVTLNRLPVTALARTWLDLADRLELPDLVAAGDSALRGGTGVDEIDEVMARASGTRGIVRARAARTLLDARSRSRPESHLRVAVVSAGLAAPEVNVPVYSALGEWLFEPDLSYRDVRLAVEYNGADHASVTRMRKDITRGMDSYVRGGWHTVAFGPAEVFGRPDQVAFAVRLLRLDLASRGAR